MQEETKKRRKYRHEDVLNLFIKSGGCCTFCKKYLFEEWMTHLDTNIGEKCHIRAFELYGPRGKDKTAKEEEINGYENLVLGCPSCHSGIDKKVIAGIITIEKIKELKKLHEDTIKTVLSSIKNTNHQIVKYCHPIGKTKLTIDDDAVRMSAFDSFRFTEPTIINLSGNELEENDVSASIKNIDSKFNSLILTRLTNNETLNICLYAIAPIYLLIYLGTLLNEKINVIPYILRRNPSRWHFDRDKQNNVSFDVIRPKSISINNKIALSINTTAQINSDRIMKTFKDENIDLWEINASVFDFDNISTEQELQEFAILMKQVFEEIGCIYGKDKTIHLFPATSNAISVSIGRCYSGKSTNKLIIYDSRGNGDIFEKILEIE